MTFHKNHGAGVDNETLGSITFKGYNDAGTPTAFNYATIAGKVADMTSGQEAGRLELGVVAYQGVSEIGLVIDGDTNSDGEVDVNIALGTGSVTTIAGTLTMGSTDFVNNSGVIQVASHPNITTLAGLTSFGSAGATTGILAGDLTMFNTVNDGNPSFSIGSSLAERGFIQAIYDSGAQTLNYLYIGTHTADGGAHAAPITFGVDNTAICQLDDSGINMQPNKGFRISSTDIITDSSGTATLSNIDALDTTTVGTFTRVGSGRRYGNTIKILPGDWVINDDAASPLSFKDGSNSGVMVNDAACEMIAFVTIPEGMKATALDIYSTNNKTVEIYELDLDSSFDFSGSGPGANETGNANTQITIDPPINATNKNVLAIVYTATATANRVWGGLLTIAPQ
jgi:hypothetical protein